MLDLSLAANRFETSLSQCGANKPGSEVFERLVQRYRETTRHYHNLEHIAHCLEGLERFVQHASHPGEVSLALWFHDAIYNPKAKDNEAKSADLARVELQALGAAQESIDRICAHIMATRDHKSDHPDAHLVIDLDLSILGSPPARYERFENEIRQEFSHVPGFLFRLARKKILKHFISRDHIYTLPFTRELWEDQARENLRRAI